MTTLRLFLKDHPIVLALYLPQVFMAVAVGLLIPILPVYAADFQISYGLIGLVIGAEALGIMFGDLPAGIISGQQGIRRTAMLGLIGIAVSYVLLFFVDSVWLVIVLRFIGGFMRAFYQVAQHQYLTSR
ncbi:MAG: MFS transporter, partial [Aggregatilineales bacterium]